MSSRRPWSLLSPSRLRLCAATNFAKCPKRWGWGRGSAPLGSARPPGPQPSRGTGLEPILSPCRRRPLECGGSLLEMLGYDQPGSFHVHGVAHVRANDLANRGTGHPMTTPDNQARPACRSRRELTRADLARRQDPWAQMAHEARSDKSVSGLADVRIRIY